MPRSLRFTVKAVDKLKYRNNYNYGQNVRFLDGPPVITMRQTPKTNKKIFQIKGKCKGHSLRMDLGQFYPDSFSILKDDVIKLDYVELNLPKEVSDDKSYQYNLIEL